MMCNLHWCYTFCTGITLFALVLHSNCTALSQSESSNFFMCIIMIVTGNATGTRTNDPILVVFLKKIEIYLIVISDHFLGAKASCCSCKTTFQIFGCKYLDCWTGLKCSSNNKNAQINVLAMKFSSITLPLHKRNCLATPTAEASFHTFIWY